MKKKLNILLMTAFMALATHAQVLCKWDAESSRPTSAQFTCYRGETLRLQPTFREYGALVTNATYTLYWQTNGMGTAWWSTNNATYFTPSMDYGASSYTLFIGASTTNGISYRANAIIRMLGAPGAIPNTLPLPVQSIDFSTVQYLNAPWLLSFAWTSWLATNTYIKAESDPGIPDAIISAVAQSGTNAQIIANLALQTLTTNRTTKLWSVNGDRFIDGTGGVWSVTSGITTNYGFSILSVVNSYGASPSETWYDLPFSEYGWTSEIFEDNAYLWYDKGGAGQCAWDTHIDFPDNEGGFLEMTLNLDLSTQLPSPPEGVAYLYKTVTTYQVTNRVDSLVSSSELASSGFVSTSRTVTVNGQTGSMGTNLDFTVTAGLTGSQITNIVQTITYTNQTWGAAGTNATYQLSWDVTNGTFRVLEIFP